MKHDMSYSGPCTPFGAFAVKLGIAAFSVTAAVVAGNDYCSVLASILTLSREEYHPLTLACQDMLFPNLTLDLDTVLRQAFLVIDSNHSMNHSNLLNQQLS